MTKANFYHQHNKKYFFDDPFEIAGYALKNFPKECERTIEIGDRVSDQQFKFNKRWDLEKTDDYVVFEGEIDWLYQPGGDPEWVYAFNRMTFWICLGQAYALTRDEKYAQVFVKQLKHWIANVTQEQEKAWRSIEVGLRLENWLKAIRYFEASPAIDDDVIKLFCDSVHEHAGFLMNLWNPYNLMSNWGILANHGLYMAGVMTPQSERAGRYTAQALKRLSSMLRMQVYRDGAHWEQSPMYHNEMLKCYLEVILLAKRNGITLPENIMRQTYDMCCYSMYSSKPDHTELCMGDSDSIDLRDLLTRGAAIFGDSELKSRAYTTPDYDSLWEIGEAGLREYEDIPVSLPTETDKAFGDSNNYFFRSGWDDAATYVHFHCGTLGAGHGHADKLHIDLFSKGEDILIDPGRFTYVFGKDRVRYKEVRAHNVLMVDGADFYVCKDSWECIDLTRGINQKYYSCDRYGYCEGGHLAYIGRGALVNRRVIYIKPDIIVIADEFYTSGGHSYNQFFHFNNSGEIRGGGSLYTYSSDNLTADMVLIADGLTSEVGEYWISRHYNQEEPGKMVTTSFSGNGFTSAFTVFAISDADAGAETKTGTIDETGETLQVDKVDVYSTFKGTAFKSSQIEALNITHGKKSYTVVVAHEEFASPTDTFNAEGCIGFGSCVVFDRTAGETEIGTVLL